MIRDWFVVFRKGQVRSAQTRNRNALDRRAVGCAQGQRRRDKARPRIMLEAKKCQLPFFLLSPLRLWDGISQERATRVSARCAPSLASPEGSQALAGGL